MALTLEDMMLQYQKETLTQQSDPLMEHQKKMQELEELARKAMMARNLRPGKRAMEDVRSRPAQQGA